MKRAGVLIVCAFLCLALVTFPHAGQAAPAAQAGTLTPVAYLPQIFVAPPQAAVPVLNVIDNAAGSAAYLVTWNAAANCTSYLLQEDDNSAFSHPVTAYVGSATQWAASAKPFGAFYYRVQGVNQWNQSGWSVVRSTTVRPNDPYFGSQWSPGVVDALRAWDYSTGGATTIAIVDTGVDLNHPDLVGRILPGRHFYAGYYDSNVQDDEGHGTHVAGIAAASGNNAIGIAGMAWGAQIMPVKVLNSSGSGYLSDIASGVKWAVDSGARVVNLSLGGPSDVYNTLKTATDYAYANGALVVASAGNCGDGNYAANGCSYQDQPVYPAAYANVFAVGATDAADRVAGWSNSGSYVDVTAPGDLIYSTYWNNGSTYAYESGTSMAAPLVAGLAALVWTRNPSLTNAQVASVIANSAVDLGVPGRDNAYGYGRVNAWAAVVAAASTVPPAPLQGDVVAAAALSARVVPDPNAPIRPGVLLVRLKKSATAADGERAFREHGAQADGELAGLGIKVVKVTPGHERQVARALQADAAIDFAEPDYQLSLIR